MASSSLRMFYMLHGRIGSGAMHLVAKTRTTSRIGACHVFRQSGILHEVMHGHWGADTSKCVLEPCECVRRARDAAGGCDAQDGGWAGARSEASRDVCKTVGRMVWAHMASAEALLAYLDRSPSASSPNGRALVITDCTAVFRLSSEPVDWDSNTMKAVKVGW